MSGFNNKFLINRNLLLIIMVLIFDTISAVTQNSFDNLPDQFLFNQAYVFKYDNSVIPDGEFGRAGEMTIYFNEQTNCWLFTEKCLGENMEQVSWILGLPNGIYISATTDSEGMKNLVGDTINFSGKVAERLKDLDSFDQTHRNTGITKLFAKDRMGFPLYSAQQHTISYPKSIDVSEQYITNSRVMMNSIYFFNERKDKLKLPARFPTDIPIGMIVLQDHTVTIDGEMHFELKEVAVVNYKIDLNEFR